LILATFGIIASIPGQTIGVGVFTDSLINAIKINRTQLSIAYMLGTVCSSFILPYAGILTDRFGTRIVFSLSAVGLGISLYVFTFANKISMVSHYVLISILLTSVCFFLIRFFGQGCLTMTARVMLGKWFNHKRGLVTGISNILVAYSFNASPAFLNYLVSLWTWQKTYLNLGLFIGIGVAIIGWIFFRDNPEECGLTMDGHQTGNNNDFQPIPETKKEYTRAEALKTISYWAFTLTCAWQALYMTAVSFHITSIGAEMGLSRAEAYAVFPMIGIVSVCIAALVGWLSDHIQLRWLLWISITFQVMTGFGQLDLSHSWHKWIFIIGYGIAGGIFGLMLTIVWPRYFGRKHLGAISGITTSILVFSSAIGPFIFSWIFQTTSSYQTTAILSIVISSLLIIPAMKVKNPQN